jgi:hypothetical protein
MFAAAIAGTFTEASFPLRHQLVDGVYMRTIFLPATTLVIGAIHKFEHFNFISKGHVTCLTEQKGMQELRGYWQGVEPAGTKRAIYCHEDTFWTTIHPTAETDFDIIRAQVTCESYSEMGWEDPVQYLNLIPELTAREVLKLELV